MSEIDRREFLRLALEHTKRYSLCYAAAGAMTAVAQPLRTRLNSPSRISPPHDDKEPLLSIQPEPISPILDGPPLNTFPQEILEKFISEATRMSSVDNPFRNLGYRISNPWQNPEGFWQIAYQTTILRFNPVLDQAHPINLLDIWHEEKMDYQLAAGELGITVPPKKDLDDQADGDFKQALLTRLARFDVPKRFQEYLLNLRPVVDFGVPTSKVEDYDGFYEVLRLQGGAIQLFKEGPDKDKILHILVGDAAFKNSFIPSFVRLLQPQNEHISAIFQKIQSKEELVSTATLPNGCSVVGSKWEGKASYYSRTGCAGCSSNQKMANGEIFNENLNTLAFMEAPLNSLVLVTNPQNGRSVEAKVTDHGGFRALDRIADLSKGLHDRLGISAGVAPIKIELLNC